MIFETVESDGTESPIHIEKIESIFRIAKDFLSPETPSDHDAGLKITQFSDSIIVSFDYTKSSQIFHRLLSLQWMLINFTLNKITCRGGAVVGKIHHSDTCVYGPGLVEAYLLESQAAFYPRIILSEEIINLAGSYKQEHHSRNEEIGYVKEILSRDSDGLYYIDYFESAQHELDDPEYDYPGYLTTLHDIIQSGLNCRNHSIRIKHLWMKEKYNNVVQKIKQNIANGKYTTQDADIYDAYSSLMTIK